MQELLLKFPAFFEECRPDHSKSFTIDDSITHDNDDEGFSSAAGTTSNGEESLPWRSHLAKAATALISPGQ
jgi:hypothetical protein